jgi:hypothetical protein
MYVGLRVILGCSVVIVLFCVLFVCKCVLPPGDNPIAVNKYINIKHPFVMELGFSRPITSSSLCFFIRQCSLRLIVRSELDVPTFATRRLLACHHARAPSGGRWKYGREMSGNFA